MSQLPEPRGPNERMLFLGVIMGTAALLVIGFSTAWMIFVAIGIGFPEEAKLILFGALSFLFGGGIAAKVN